MPAARSTVVSWKSRPSTAATCERVADLGAQRQQALADRVADPVGQRHALAQGLVDAALGDEQAHDLVGVEGVALGQMVQRVHQLLGRVGAAAVDDQRAQVVVLQAAEVEARAEARELAEDGLDLGPAPRPRLVMGGDHEHARLAQRAGEEGEQQQRRQVGGVQVVEEHDQRLARRRVAQEDRDGVEEGEAGLLGLEVARLGQVEALAKLGRELGHPARAGAELRTQGVVVAVGGEGAHDLHPRPERGRAAAVPAARPRDAMAVARGALTQRGGQARLADAGLAREQDEAAAAGRRLLERGVQIGQLPRASEKGKLAGRADGVRALADCIPH